MPRQNKEQAVTNALREEGLKIIGSDKATSTEKMHWSKLLFDMQDVTKQELTVQVKQAEDAREAAESTLKTVQDALAAANAKVAELEPLAAQLPDVTAQYAELKANFDVRVSEMRNELVAEAQQRQWNAERAENAATEKLREADNKVSASGWTQLRSTMADLIARHAVPMPSFWETSPTMPSAFWTLWGWSDTKAKIFTACKAGYKEPSSAFRARLLRHLKATLPLQQTFAGMEPPAPIENLDVKIAAMTEMAQRWSVWPDIQREFEDAQVERQAEYLREHHAQMAAQQNDAARRGEGRTPIVPEQPASITGYTGPHDPDCCCGRPGCNPLPAHLREDVWLGTRPSEAKVEDINARHEVNTMLDYGQRLIEREALAKKGKVVTVLPPDSVTLDGHHSLDDEETL